jgi:hypothetical protein
VHGLEIDWEEMERVDKMLRLNGGPDYDAETERLLAASLAKRKPTVRIKRLGSKLQGGSTLQRQLLETERLKQQKILDSTASRYQD